MLVGIILVAAVFAAGVVGWRIATGGDDGNAERDRLTWSSLAFVDRVSGDAVFVDSGGEVIGESLANGRTGSVHGVGGVLTLVNSQRAAVLPEPGSNEPPLVVQLPRGATVLPVSGDDVTYLVAGAAAGGDVVVIDPAAGEQHDIGALVDGLLTATPSMRVDSLRTNADGSILAIADATNFQTIVIQPHAAEPVFLPDQPVAVGDDLVATSQTVGTQGDVALVALDRSTRAVVPTEIPAGGVFDGDAVVMVSYDGGVFRVEPGDDRADRIGAITIPAGGTIAWARPALGGQRLVVGGDTFEAVVDLEGQIVFSTTFTGVIEPVVPDPGWACVPVGGSDRSHSIVDLDTGEQLADLTGVRILDVADQGCAVLVDRNGVTEIVTPEGVATLGPVAATEIGPGGRSVVRITGDGLTELLLLGDDLTVTETIDLTEIVARVGDNPLVAFVESPD